jgi:phospholipase/carboxylesterase
MSYVFHYQPATNSDEKRTLLLLHGTGGGEHDLVTIAEDLLPGAAILSPRGLVKEMGMNRWFKRFKEGVFDEDDIRLQAGLLAEFVKEQSQVNGPLIALGYSNGANMGAALMTLYPEVLDGLIMWRGMQIFQEPIEADLIGKDILMTNGIVDPMAPVQSAKFQAEIFQKSGASVNLYDLGTGHSLTQSDFEITQAWLNDKPSKNMLT